MRKLIVALAAAGLSLVALAPTASAGYPTPTITPVFDGPTAEYGENVTFEVVDHHTPNDVLLVCYQTPGRFNLMYGEVNTTGSVTFPMLTTYGFAWDPDLDATCTADVGHAKPTGNGNVKRVVDAEVTFTLHHT